MCGIVGQINLNPSEFVAEDNIHKMMDAIFHRGPDDSGFFVRGHVGLGFRRLSIIDLEGGHQPIFNEDDTIALIANGEIYNFPELRKQMTQKGHTFKTDSDVEVILHLYEEYGEQFVGYLNGMFAICLYDIAKDIFILARDRMGIKPLYVLSNEKGVFFGSEIKGILASSEVKKQKEAHVLEELLLFRFLSNNRTFFKGIKSLPPGEMLVVCRGKIRTQKFLSEEVSRIERDDSNLPQEIFDELTHAVKIQSVSDVPIGTFLSGGIDSSFVTALGQEVNPHIKSFTIGFDEVGYDESSYAKIVSQKFNTEYHELRVSNTEFSDHLEKTIWFNDEPLNHANSVHIYLLSRYAKQFVTVLLTGEGADEIFAGYPRYYINKIGYFLESIGMKNRMLIALACRWSKKRKLIKLGNLLKGSLDEMILMNSAFIEKSDLDALFPVSDTLLSGRKQVLREVRPQHHDPLDRLLAFDQKTYLQSILSRTDKMSMAASVEARVPFLDNGMMALTNSICGEKKLQRFQAKYLLKESSKKILPVKLVQRKKVGFSVPIGSWLRDSEGLGRYLHTVLDDQDIIEKISRKKLEKLATEHKTSVANHAEILWPLINYALWNKQFF